LLTLLIAWRLIQDGMDAANQQAKGITGGEPVQDLDYLPDLGGSIVQPSQPFAHATA